MGELTHLWCTHCNTSVCGISGEEGIEPGPSVGDDTLVDCIVCSDLSTAVGRFTDCLREIA